MMKKISIASLLIAVVWLGYLGVAAQNKPGLYNARSGSGSGDGGGGVGTSSDNEMLYNNAGVPDGSSMTWDGTDHTIGSGLLRTIGIAVAGTPASTAGDTIDQVITDLRSR